MRKEIEYSFFENKELYKSIKFISNDSILGEIENSSILITGGTGFIIRYFVYMILCRNDELNSNIKLYLLVRNYEKTKKLYGSLLERNDIYIICGDVCDEFDIDNSISFIIHAAGPSNPQMIKSDPVGTFNANIIGYNNVLKFAQLRNVNKILFISSYMVYGGDVNINNLFSPHLSPIDFTKTCNCYAQSKRSGEMLCACYHEQYGIDIKIIRPSFVFGVSDDNDVRVWSEIIQNVARNKNVVLNSNGLSIRPVVYVMDIVLAMLYVLIRGDSCVGYNIESDLTTIRNFAQIAVDYPKTKSNLLFKNASDCKIDGVESIVLKEKQYDMFLPVRKLGWVPKWNLKDAIFNAIEIEKNRIKENL